MNTTTYVVCGFHQGRKLRPQQFNTEAQAREHALAMGESIDCVVLTTSTERSITQRDHWLPAVSQAPLKSEREPALA